MEQLEESISLVLDTLGGIIWGPFVLIPLLAITGFVLTVRLRGIQFTKLGPALRLGLKDRRDEGADDGDVSQFQALTTALAATVGTGNIVGVATAIALGGPGAVFWMWVTGILGMASKYSEAFLAVRYRTKDDAGEVSGGPQYYLERGITKKVGGVSIGKVLAISFAVFAVIASFGIGNMTQANAIARNVGSSWGLETWVVGIVLMIAAFAVLIGGIKSIGRVTSALVPLMILLYVVASIWILLVNVSAVPAAFGLIFTDAFTGTAATGGFIGATIAQAMRFGMARGIFSNESGMGSAAIAAAAAKTTHPVRQGLVSMTQTFIDTIIVVTCTALVLITTGAWATSEDNAAFATGEAFSSGLPGQWGHWVVTISLALFAFSTILGWCYYGERCVERLVGRGGVMPYRVIFCIVVYIGATTSLSLVWGFADVMNGLMALPNLIGLLVMSGLIARETRHYLQNDPDLRASKAQVAMFMKDRDGGIDTYELTGR
ncbi:alanine/glycine:cation symporter family protein [Flaviflexus salsibiostraticola]|uniref:alanine/glycine:cation symporter family protein n=1 Tax=Flaviflexus salsibiostraticola TaxID=1282737 RepID=UPI001B860897|nr:sodium:alanine symporter family protein [Flaviflexus salsibiostraticola]